MSNVAIRASGLGKRYRIGAAAVRHASLREALTHAFTAPLRNLDRLRRLSRFDDGESTDIVWALRDVDFEIARGEAVGVIGRNGAGKSTLLKILSRITEPTTGQVEVHGRVGSLLEVGTGFHPELTGRENVYLNGSILGMDRAYINRRFDEIVEFAGVERFIETPVKRYSSGMYLRLAFAVAAHLEPEILLMDEVLAVGDAEFQKKCLGKMGAVAGEGRTVVFVSHNMGAIANLCTRGIVLRGGGIVHDGKVSEAIHCHMQLSGSQSGVSLAERADRRGHGRVRFTSVELESSHGHALEHGTSGLPLEIVLRYRSNGGAYLPNARVSVSIHDPIGQPLMLCSTDLVHAGVATLAPEGELRCRIPRLPLSQGNYLLGIFFEVDGQVEDWMEDAATLQVVDGDFYGSGKQYPEGWGGVGVLVPHEWDWEGKPALSAARGGRRATS